MLRTESVASFIERKLNEYGATHSPSFKFKLFAEVGENKPDSAIKGIVLSAKGNPGEIANYIDVDYPFTCTLLVPCAMSNYEVINVRAILDELIENYNGHEINVDDGKGIISFSTPEAGQYKTEAGVGGCIPISFTINVKYTTQSVTASNKRWFLNGMEIPYSSESVLIDKDGITRKINGENYSKTQLTGQVKYYKFVFPYDTKNNLCVMLQQDILNGNFEKTYELKFYDGKSFTEEEPFVSTVSIYKNADTSAQPTKTSIFNITFTDVDNGNGSIKYYIALCDTIFDDNSVNTRFFEATETKTAQQVQIEYWESKISCAYEQIKAPNLNSIDITSQVYKNTNSYELFDLTNKNYAIIKVEQNGVPIKYYYYFVTNAIIGAQNQVMFDLKLDTIQTYLFDDDIEFSDCFIRRAHLNRWIDNGDGTISFDGTVNSKLFEREEIQNVAKRLVSRTKISFNTYFEDETINSWLDENVLAWVYIFCNPDTRYTLLDTSNGELTMTYIRPEGTDVQYIGRYYSYTDIGFAVLCYPIYKSSNHIIFNLTGTNISQESETRRRDLYAGNFDDFREQNNGDTQIYGIKLSGTPPFYFKSDGEKQSCTGAVDASGNLTISANVGPIGDSYTTPFANGHLYSILQDGNGRGALFGIDFQDPYIKSNFTIPQNFKFNKIDITNSSGLMKTPELNPKLLSSDFASLKICDQSGEGFDFDIQKLNKNNIELKISEPLNADVTKTYVTISNLDGVYNEDLQYNFTGFVGQNDYSLVRATTQYQQMLANNKNYFLQNSIGRGLEFAKGATTTGFNIATGNVFGAISSGVGTLTSPFTSIINQALTVDNMKNAPADIISAKGNALLNLTSAPFGIYIEIWDVLPNEKEIINDYMCQNGFAVNQYDNVKNVWNIRKYYNYVKADLDAIIGVSISNVARADIKQRFQNGIRFWNSDNIQYDLENYENWLEN